MATEVRVIYHPAPFPGPDGALRTPEPIDLGSDLARAEDWMRRRLSLVNGEPAIRFTADVLDIDVVAAPLPDAEIEQSEADARLASEIDELDALADVLTDADVSSQQESVAPLSDATGDHDVLAAPGESEPADDEREPVVPREASGSGDFLADLLELQNSGQDRRD